MKFRVTAEKVGRLIASIADPVSATMRAARRLPLFRAVVTFAARACGSPRDAITHAQRLAGPIRFQSGAKLDNAANRFVSENDWQSDGQFTFPQMHIGPANTGHVCAYERRAWFRGAKGILAGDERRIEFFQNGGASRIH